MKKFGKKNIIICGIIGFLVCLSVFAIVLHLKSYFVLTFDTDGGNKIEDKKILKGKEIGKLEIPSKEGEKFLYWELDGNKIDETYKVTSNITLKAIYEKDDVVKEYVVSFDTDGGSKIDPQKVKKNEKAIKPESPEKKGYILKEWQLEGKTYNFNSVVTKDITLKAIYVEKEIKLYTIKFNTDGGSEIQDKIVEEGKVVSKPVSPRKEGYIFKEWQLNGVKYNFSTKIDKDITLKAVYTRDPNKKETYTITFDTDGGSKISSQSIEENNVVAKPSNPTKEGYIFKEWQLEGKAYDFNTKVTSNITLKAIYDKEEAKKYTVTFDTDGGSKIETQSIEENKTVAKPSNPTKEGYIFKEWQLEGRAYDFNTKVTSNITLKAIYDKEEAKKYTVTFDTDGGSKIETQSIEENKTVTKPSNPTKEGYIFKEWQLEGKAYDFNTKVTSNITLKAIYDKKEQ